MDIYIKPTRKVDIVQRKMVYIKDIAEVVTRDSTGDAIKDMVVLKITDDTKKNYLITVMDMIKVIQQKYPNDTVNNLGEMESIVVYYPEKNKDNNLFQYIKIAFVTLVLLAGSSTAIMSFHSDAQMPAVFRNYYYMFFGKATDAPWIIDIPYSVGLAVGIIVFFNHFSGKKLTDDPTPIQVEMALYEKDVDDTLVEELSTERQEQGEE